MCQATATLPPAFRQASLMLVPSAFLMDGERHSENEVFCRRTQDTGPREIWDLESDCKATASPQNCINPLSLRVTSI